MEPNPFVAAIGRERYLREEAYLGTAHNICGIPCRQITPRILAVLFRLKTPFLIGTEVMEEDTLRFLWTVDRNNPMRVERNLFRRSKQRQFLDFIAQGFDFERAEVEIDQFLEDTFMDAPEGKPSRPYVCSIAWIEYSMAGKPFCWPRDYTMDQPLRIIYQLLRCRALDNGAVITNRLSDPILQGALDELNTPEAIAQRAEEFRAKHRN